jgi:hypothetical protein
MGTGARASVIMHDQHGSQRACDIRILWEGRTEHMKRMMNIISKDGRAFHTASSPSPQLTLRRLIPSVTKI